MDNIHLPKEARLASDELTVFERFRHLLDLRDRTVLEVGGRLDARLVNICGVAKWWSLDPRNPQSPSYGAAQSIQGRVEATPLPDQAVDYIFSCNAFQHIQDLARGLSEMSRVLRGGGYLYANFGPVWSAPDGSHIEALTVNGRRYDFWEQALLPAWSHLVFCEEELTELLSVLHGAELAAAISHYVFHSSWINRLFYDDYEPLAQASQFEIIFLGGCVRIDYNYAPPQIEHSLSDRLHPDRLKSEIQKRHGSDKIDIHSRDVELILRKRE